jgi:predicted nucleic acid-binding protein
VTIVSDTSPISYLVLIGEAEVLPRLYGEVLVPRAVRRELGHPQGPEAVRNWIETSPSWLTVKDVEEEGNSLQSLDPGEREAILLASREDAGLLLIDEQAGREVAEARDLELTGTIGVLGAAARKGYTSAARSVRALKNTTFRASPDLYRWLLRQE